MHARWLEPLAFEITPKAGPLPRIVTLLDANQVVLHDLPQGWLRQREHWYGAARALVSGAADDNLAAYEAIVAAREREGWLSSARTRRDRPVPPGPGHPLLSHPADGS